MLRIADLAFGLIAQFKNMHVEVPKLPRGMQHDDFLRVLHETQKDVLTYDVRRHAHCINVLASLIWVGTLVNQREAGQGSVQLHLLMNSVDCGH